MVLQKGLYLFRYNQLKICQSKIEVILQPAKNSIGVDLIQVFQVKPKGFKETLLQVIKICQIGEKDQLLLRILEKVMQAH
jgi:hypothetical protein